MKFKRGIAIICAGCLLLTALIGGMAAQANPSYATMTDGTVAFMDASGQNRYATPHGAVTVVNIANPVAANTWLMTSTENFGVTPSYGYGFDTKSANYTTSETGVYFRIKAGAKAEVAFQGHHTYTANSYSKVRLYWSIDAENWTEITTKTLSQYISLNSNHRTFTYTVQLPNAETAGSNTVYLDVRFPTESLSSNGNTDKYSLGAFMLSAVRTSFAKEPTMADGTVAYMNNYQQLPYATPHGDALKIINIGTPVSANAWIMQSTPVFGITPTFGYGFDSQHSNFANDNTGVYFRIKAGAKAEVALQGHHTYTANSYQNVKLYWSADAETWTEITSKTISEYTAVTTNHRSFTYTVQLPDLATAGSDTVYLDVRFPTEGLVNASTAYGKGAFMLTALRTSFDNLPTMTDGTIAYMNSAKEDLYATPHGEALVKTIIDDPTSSNYWLRDELEYFGVKPSYGYAFNSQHSDYLSDKTGVYYRVEAGLAVDIGMQYHWQSQVTYSQMEFFWSADAENWKPLTSYSVTPPQPTSKATEYVIFTVLLPDAETAGGNIVYLDVRFPTVHLHLDGATTTYANGGLHIAAVRARKSGVDDMKTMVDGTIAVMDTPDNSAYSLGHGAAVKFNDLLTDSQADPYWVRPARIAYFGSEYASSYGYAVKVDTANYASQNNGVYYKIQSGLYATIALPYHFSYTSAADNFTFYAGTSPHGDDWVKLTPTYTTQTLYSTYCIAYYTVKLPTTAECGSDTVFLDVRFPTEDLGATSVYPKGNLNISAVKTSAAPLDTTQLNDWSTAAILEEGELVNFETATSTTGWSKENATLSVTNNALKAQISAGNFTVSSTIDGLSLPYGASYLYLTAKLRANNLEGDLVFRVSSADGTQWIEYDITAASISSNDFATVDMHYGDPDRSSPAVDYSKLSKLTISGKANSSGATLELQSVSCRSLNRLIEDIIASIPILTAQNYTQHKDVIATARAACEKLVNYSLSTPANLYEAVGNYARLVNAENDYVKFLEAAMSSIAPSFALSKSEISVGETVTATVTVNATEGNTVPELSVKFTASYFTVSATDDLTKNISAGGTSASATTTFKANEGGVALITANVCDQNGATLYTETVRLSVTGKGWYKSDNHSHSTRSDGKGTMTQNFLSAYNKGLGFLITADHNANASTKNDVELALSNLKASIENIIGFKTFKATELTGDRGHMLQYGTDKNTAVGTSVETWQEIIDNIVNNGGASYLAHPFYNSYFYPGIENNPTSIGVYKNFTGVEIINTSGENIASTFKTFPQESVKALEFFDRLNIKGDKKFFGIANSDAHLSSGIATAYSVFLLDNVTEENVFEAIAETGAFYGTTGPQLRFSINDTQMGSTLTARKNSTATISVAAADDESYITKITLISYKINPDDVDTAYQNGQRTVLYSDDGTNAKSVIKLSKEVPVEDGTFYRLEVESAEQGYVRFAFSNPIWMEGTDPVPADYTEINRLKSTVPADLSVYTESSAKAVTDALSAIKEGKYDDEQSVVDGWAKALKAAIDALTLKTPASSDNDNSNTSSGNVSSSNTPSGNTSSTNSDSASSDLTSSETASSDTVSKDDGNSSAIDNSSATSADVASNAPILVIALAVLGAVAVLGIAALIIIKHRKK